MTVMETTSQKKGNWGILNVSMSSNFAVLIVSKKMITISIATSDFLI
jgi:hypothetical protein